MSKLGLAQYVVGQVQTNCYVITNEETKEALIIDPGANGQALADRIRNDGWKPVAILITHGHFDHIGGAEVLAKEFGIKVYIHEMEKETLTDVQLNACWMIGKNESYKADVFLKDEEELDLAGFHLRVLFTPGHTPGGCCYYLPYEDILFSGDTLFCESVGRTDFEGGSMSALVRSIKEKLMKLPDKTVVYPGHGEATTIDNERMYNPYL